jgi:hypothetical protein
MSAEDRHRSLWDLVQILNEAGAFRLERFDDMTIVYDLVSHVDWGAILDQRPIDDIDRADNPRAKPAGLSQNDLHPLTLSPKLRRVRKNRR